MPSTRLALTPEQRAELWFSKIERDVIARGVFTSVTDLRRKLMRYIKVQQDRQSRSGGPTPIRRGASHDRCTSRSDGPLDDAAMHCASTLVEFQVRQRQRG